MSGVKFKVGPGFSTIIDLRLWFFSEDADPLLLQRLASISYNRIGNIFYLIEITEEINQVDKE